MGTSQSSNGPSGGVPLVPPWVPDVEEPAPSDITPDSSGTDQEEMPAPLPSEVPPSFIAPRGRFSGTRRSMGRFASTGSTADMRRGLQHYVSTGYQGAKTTTKRHGGTIRTAAALYGTLTPLADGGSENLKSALLDGKSAEDIMDAVIEATRPVDGTQDAESSRISIKEALVALLDRFPEVNLLELTEDQRRFAVERFVAMEIYRRFVLDLGSIIKERASDALVALTRFGEIQIYILEATAASFREIRATGKKFDATNIKRLIQTALQKTFKVFETYSE